MWSAEELNVASAVPGDVLALLTEMQEIPPGLYLVESMTDAWITLRWLFDDETSGRLILMERASMIPAALLEFFMPVGIRLKAYS